MCSKSAGLMLVALCVAIARIGIFRRLLRSIQEDFVTTLAYRTLALAAVAALGVVSEANAALIAYEPFAYAAGALPTSGSNADPGQIGFANTNWQDTIGAGNHSATVSSPSLITGNSSYDQNSSGGYVAVTTNGSNTTTSNTAAYLNPLSSSAISSLASDSNPGSVFVSALLQPSQVKSSSFNGSGLLELYNSGNTSSGGAIIKMGNNASANPGAYWGISPFSGTAGANSYGFGAGDTSNTVAVTTGTTLLVMELTYTATGNDTINLWVNPTSTSSPQDATFTVSGGLAQIQGIELVQNSGTDSTTNFTTDFDEIRIGNTFADVVPTPEPTTAATLGILGIAACLRRRRR